MKVKTFKQSHYNFLVVNNHIICSYDEGESQLFMRCSNAGITEEVIQCVNDFRKLYNLSPITLEYFLKEFIVM